MVPVWLIYWQRVCTTWGYIRGTGTKRDSETWRKLIMQIHKCVRCGHEWASRAEVRPNRCAKCTARNWWKPPREVNAGVDKKMGRPCRYPIENLEVGQAIMFPWHRLPTGWPDVKQNRIMNVCIQNYAHRTGRNYRRQSSPKGLLVTRVG